jgi:hypothetical protein
MPPGTPDGANALFSEAPVHQACLLFAAHVCPHLSSPGHRMGDEYRAGQRREPTLTLRAFARTTGVEVFESGLQRIPVVHFELADRVDQVTYA